MSSWIEEKELFEQRARLVGQAGDIIKKAHAEDRDLTNEENEQFERLHADADKYTERVNLGRKQREAENSIVGREDFDVEKSQPKQNRFERYLRYGNSVLSEAERYDMATDSTGAGKELVPEDYHTKLFEVLQDMTDVLSLGPEIIKTSNGRPYPVPRIDDSSNTGERLSGENESVTADGSSDPDTADLTLGHYIYSSKVIKLPLALVEDAAFGIQDKVINMGAVRVSKVLNVDLTTGTGSSQPQGYVTGASSSGVSSSSATAVTYTEILDLIHSLARPYRKGAKLVFNDTTLLAIKKLTDGDGNLLWFGGNPAAGMAPTIAGVEYGINVNMADMAAGAKPIVYGNFGLSYCVRLINNVQTFVFVEKYMDKLQRGYLTVVRADGGVVDSNGLVYFQNKNS